MIDKEVVEMELKYFLIVFDLVEACYVKVEVCSFLCNLDWYFNLGGKSWIFLDEILLFGFEEVFDYGGISVFIDYKIMK